MSRSNPELNQNPCTRWYEWDGGKGNIRYYDKSIEDKEQRNVEVPLPFTFLWLNQLSKIGGWSDQNEASIYSNEVKNISKDSLTVKVYNGGTLAQGKYSEIKDSVKAKGGHYVASVYIAYKDDNGALQIGNLSLKGAALSAWMDFQKSNFQATHEKAVIISGYEEGKKGSIVYRMPKFKLDDVSGDTQEAALDLDKVLDAYLSSKTGYEPEPPASEPDPPPLAESAETIYGDVNDNDNDDEMDNLPF